MTTGDWSREVSLTASGRLVETANTPGASKTLHFRGTSVELEVPTNAAAGAMRVTLDDRNSAEVKLPARESGVWKASDLSDGWHTLRVEVLSGTVTLDTARICRLSGVTVLEPAPPASDCGCQGDRQNAFLLFPLLLLGRRRRIFGTS